MVRLPLKKSATIVHGNALRIDWNDVVPVAKLSYMLGNPPFIGAKLMTDEQRNDLLGVAGNLKSAGLLDFVCGWYLKAAALIQSGPSRDAGNAANTPSIRCAFVSTNSITQGEQVGILWGALLAQGVHIQFAHRTFRWNNEARGIAAVHCVIVGFGLVDIQLRRLFDYTDIVGEPHEVLASNINPYLVDAPDVLLPNRSRPICKAPEIGIGNKPIDGGYYLFTDEGKNVFLEREPGAAEWFRRWLGADEFINGWQRWCLFLRDMPPDILRSMPHVMDVVASVRSFRLGELPPKSANPVKPIKERGISATALANTPTHFHVTRVSKSAQLVIPSVSSERRSFIPIGFEPPETLCSNLVLVAVEADLYHFAVLSSTIHMSWVRSVCGRLESRFRYSAGIVYNNFPWPDLVDDKRRTAIETAAQGVLDTRARFPGSTLADLYDPLSMPPALVKAHQALDRAVDAAYVAAEKAAGRRPPNLGTDAERVAFLFERYQALTSLLPAAAAKPKNRRTRRTVT